MTIQELINALIQLNKPAALVDIQLADTMCYQIADVFDPEDGGDVVFILATQAGYKPIKD